MDLIVDGSGFACFGAHRVRCAVGRAGLTLNKREGDLATPVGRFLCREVLWRADRMPKPITGLPSRALSPDLGWCDDPTDAQYNRRVTLPYAARHELLWRDDGLYDLIVPLGYNDAPPIAGLGSAIFLHVARADFAGTEGCVALARDDLLRFLAEADAASAVSISPPN